MAYGLWNDHVTDDVTWPWKIKLVIPKRLERNISKTAGFRDSFQRTTNRKWHMGYQMVTWPMTLRDPKGDVRQYGRLSCDSLASCSELLFFCNFSLERTPWNFGWNRDTADRTCYILKIVSHSNLFLNTICFVYSYTTKRGVRYREGKSRDPLLSRF